MFAIRQERLFEMFQMAQDFGVSFAKISDVDQLVAERKAALLLKHDIHGLNLDRLVEFAEREKKMGISGTYYFMPSDHPVTVKHFDIVAQFDAMRAISALGHELGLHIDPYFQIHQKEQPLDDILRRILDDFATGGVGITNANMHGNSRHKHLDKNNYGTSFDLFAEIGRQQDYPALKDVPEESAVLIRANRVQLKDFGITHWGDMPIWSAKNGFVLTNFMTDNQLGKKGTIELMIRRETSGAYCLAATQPPGSRNIGPIISRVETCEQDESTQFFHEHVSFDSGAPRMIADFLKNGTPMLFLIHPENYV